MTYDASLIKLLNEEYVVMERSSELLAFSLERVSDIDLGSDLDFAELERLDSFNSRFMRCYEVIANQILRTILLLVGNEQKTFVDRMNKAEQLDLITSYSEINECRKLRNMIAHEYLMDQWRMIYQQLKEATPTLLNSREMIIKFIDDRFENS